MSPRQRRELVRIAAAVYDMTAVRPTKRVKTHSKVKLSPPDMSVPLADTREVGGVVCERVLEA
jgi:hypothetical protein